MSAHFPGRPAMAFAAVVVALSTAGCGTLDRDAVQTEVQKIQSDAAEGMLVAQEAARDRVYTNFIEIRSAELHHSVEQAEEKLDSTPAEDGAAPLAEQAVSLAAQIRSNLQSLHEHPDDRALAGRVRDNLSELADKASEIEAKL